MAGAGAASDCAVWVYGVAGRELAGAPRGPGVDDRHEPRLIRHAGLAAIVSDVPRHDYDESALRESLEDFDWLERVARAHERVLDSVLSGGSVVPCPICTIYRTDSHVWAMLEADHDRLAAALARLRGATEWGLKAYLLPDAPAEPAGARGAPSGIAYLERKRDARRAQESAREAADTALVTIHTVLRAHARDTVLNAPQDRRLSGREGDMVLNAAYLVADDARDRFYALLDELVRRHAPESLAFELSGPWPAYHFASVLPPPG